MTPEEYARMHQKSFRVAYDFLNSHFPPVDSADWFNRFAQELSEASIKLEENDLAIELLVAVYNYLEKYIQGREHNAGSSD